MIRVLLVDDSQITLTILGRMLVSDSGIQVVGTAKHGREALARVEELDPDVICTDLHMPVMDGLEFTRQVMKRFRKPILVVSVSVHQANNHDNIFSLLEAGAIDVFPKPREGLNQQDGRLTQELIRKIKVLSGVVPIGRHGRDKIPAAPGSPRDGGGHAAAARSATRLTGRLVAIGASTGGPQALQTILSALPQGFPAPVICVQHISEGFLPDLVSWLDNHSPLAVQVAEHGESPKAGCVYFPPEDHHLAFDAQGRFVHRSAVPEEHYRPSVNVTFHSVAEHFGRQAVAVLLTGMGDDGAQGLKAIRDAGGATVAQDENSCVVFGMPKKAIDLGAARLILPLSDIASTLAGLNLSGSSTRGSE